MIEIFDVLVGMITAAGSESAGASNTIASLRTKYSISTPGEVVAYVDENMEEIFDSDEQVEGNTFVTARPSGIEGQITMEIVAEDGKIAKVSVSDYFRSTDVPGFLALFANIKNAQEALDTDQSFPEIVEFKRIVGRPTVDILRDNVVLPENGENLDAEYSSDNPIFTALTTAGGSLGKSVMNYVNLLNLFDESGGKWEVDKISISINGATNTISSMKFSLKYHQCSPI
jgi:hypothetical protein